MLTTPETTRVPVSDSTFTDTLSHLHSHHQDRGPDHYPTATHNTKDTPSGYETIAA